MAQDAFVYGRRGEDIRTLGAVRVVLMQAVIRDDAEVLAMWREAMKQKQGQRTDIVDNINEVRTSKGTSRAYTVSRLQRESPELFANHDPSGELIEQTAHAKHPPAGDADQGGDHPGADTTAVGLVKVGGRKPSKSVPMSANKNR